MMSFQTILRFTLVMGTIAPLLSSTALAMIPVPPRSPSSLEGRSTLLIAGRPRNARNTSSSGGRRGECPVGNKQLMVLIPETDPGNTTQSHPTFLFYLPFGRTSFQPSGKAEPIEITTAKFMLLDENRRPFLKEPIVLSLPDEPGIVRFTLPASEKPLEVDRDYNWFFSIVCDPEQPSANPSVQGWLTRVQTPPSLTSQLKKLPQQDQHRAYQDAKLWFEHLALLAQNRAIHAEDWQQRLSKFGLQEFAQRAIVELRPANSPQ